ncbi:family 4 glycosyl hydrolase [Alkaliphilus crotonatoxidans]
MKTTKIAYIGGGSKAWAKNFMSDLLLQKEINGELCLYDIEKKAALRNQQYFQKLEKSSNSVGQWNCTVKESLEETLKDAEFVVISILPGTFDEMTVDVHLPEKYGILQSVGDTVGPGGYNRALRTIPIYIEFASAIRKHCPEAWVINYTNPMTLCIAALYREFPEIKAFGCCHEVFSTQLLLKEIYQGLTSDDGEIHRRDIKVNVQGINHFTWVNEARYKDIDLFPLYRKFADENYQKGYMIEKYRKDAHTDRVHFTFSEKVKFDLFRRFGVIAAAGDRHLAEFMPSSYLTSKERVEEMGYHLTPVSWRKEDAINKIQLTERQNQGIETVKLEPSDEEGVDQIKALLGCGDLVTNVNLPNYGQLPDLPWGSVVETNAVFTGNSVKPVLAGKIDSQIKPLLYEHGSNQQNFIEAYFRKDKQALFEAFYNDPATKRLERIAAKRLFSELIDGTKNYLEEWVVGKEIV